MHLQKKGLSVSERHRYKQTEKKHVMDKEQEGFSNGKCKKKTTGIEGLKGKKVTRHKLNFGDTDTLSLDSGNSGSTGTLSFDSGINVLSNEERIGRPSKYSFLDVDSQPIRRRLQSPNLRPDVDSQPIRRRLQSPNLRPGLTNEKTEKKNTRTRGFKGKKSARQVNEHYFDATDTLSIDSGISASSTDTGFSKENNEDNETLHIGLTNEKTEKKNTRTRGFKGKKSARQVNEHYFGATDTLSIDSGISASSTDTGFSKENNEDNETLHTGLTNEKTEKKNTRTRRFKEKKSARQVNEHYFGATDNLSIDSGISASSTDTGFSKENNEDNETLHIEHGENKERQYVETTRKERFQSSLSFFRRKEEATGRKMIPEENSGGQQARLPQWIPEHGESKERQYGETVRKKRFKSSLSYFRRKDASSYNEIDSPITHSIQSSVTPQNVPDLRYFKEALKNESTVRNQPSLPHRKWTGICIDEFDPLIASFNIKHVKNLLQQGKLPTQKTLNVICQILGRKSKVVKIICSAICEHIKSKHDGIIHVWAAYTVEHSDRITFVTTLKERETETKTKPLRLDKMIDYSFVKQYSSKFSPETREIMEQNDPYEGLDDEAYRALQRCITKHSGDLMKKHKFLSIITASSQRSKGYGSSWKLSPEKCIVLYTMTKNYIPIAEEPFHSHYDDIPVDVREGAFFPFGCSATDKLDPVRMGCQIRGDFIGNKYIEGTLGCFIDHPQFGCCGLTCAHVLLSHWELQRLKTIHNGTLKWPLHDLCKNVYQPADPAVQNSAIGHIVQLIFKEGSTENSGMDLALFKVTDRQPKSASFPETTWNTAGSFAADKINYNNWRICDVNRLNRKGTRVIKFGSKTELREGIIEFDSLSVKELNCYPLLQSEYAAIKLFKQIEVKPYTNGLDFASFGDSGALVFLVEENVNHTCLGIVEGGTSYGTVVVTPIVPILEELNVLCLKNFETETQLSNIHDHLNNLDRNVQSLGINVQGLHGNLQTAGHEIQNIKTTVANEFDAIKQILQNGFGK